MCLSISSLIAKVKSSVNYWTARAGGDQAGPAAAYRTASATCRPGTGTKLSQHLPGSHRARTGDEPDAKLLTEPPEPHGRPARTSELGDRLVGMPGFEPGASCSQSRRANQAAPHPAAKPAEAYPVGHQLACCAIRLDVQH